MFRLSNKQLDKLDHGIPLNIALPMDDPGWSDWTAYARSMIADIDPAWRIEAKAVETTLGFPVSAGGNGMAAIYGKIGVTDRPTAPPVLIITVIAVKISPERIRRREDKLQWPGYYIDQAGKVWPPQDV